MGTAWNGTPEQREVIREISKYPVGTEAATIFDNFDSQTWEALKRANRISGKTKEWAVYRILCRMLKDPEILAKVEEIRVNVGIT
ncbi:hypothetical protein, partial [Viridibacillus arvi]|uniref:hypothetical protein n=1 Tax=Viridibacillus arvi TaxID=263475 RepID=UPI003D07D877